MAEDTLYEERLTSLRTELLFVFLMLVAAGLCAWRVSLRGWDWLAILCLCISAMFLFYVLNYRVLHITLTSSTLTVRFSFMPWRIPLSTISGCRQDDISLWRIGGAGIHFSSFARRYRAMFNFLEYPRVIVELKEKRGLVRDIAFTTRQPEKLMRLLEEGMGRAGTS